ncbi:unnamed protein product [Staurois parvus]|uniref:Uncharacterized protein n=1 Tax=Staurois parvus TaxID=386267 RepID=A0ABN9B8F8_9NEOB|nr:unnamed protein product [Staurois parvus]
MAEQRAVNWVSGHRGMARLHRVWQDCGHRAGGTAVTRSTDSGHWSSPVTAPSQLAEQRATESWGTEDWRNSGHRVGGKQE